MIRNMICIIVALLKLCKLCNYHLLIGAQVHVSFLCDQSLAIPLFVWESFSDHNSSSDRLTVHRRNCFGCIRRDILRCAAGASLSCRTQLLAGQQYIVYQGALVCEPVCFACVVFCCRHYRRHSAPASFFCARVLFRLQRRCRHCSCIFFHNTLYVPVARPALADQLSRVSSGRNGCVCFLAELTSL